MTDSDDPTGKLKEEQAKKKREEALPERILRRVLEGMGSVVDRRLGRTVEPRSGLTTSKLIERMKKLIAERVRDEGKKGRVAPHQRTRADPLPLGCVDIGSDGTVLMRMSFQAAARGPISADGRPIGRSRKRRLLMALAAPTSDTDGHLVLAPERTSVI